MNLIMSSPINMQSSQNQQQQRHDHHYLLTKKNSIDIIQNSNLKTNSNANNFYQNNGKSTSSDHEQDHDQEKEGDMRDRLKVASTPSSLMSKSTSVSNSSSTSTSTSLSSSLSTSPFNTLNNSNLLSLVENDLDRINSSACSSSSISRNIYNNNKMNGINDTEINIMSDLDNKLESNKTNDEECRDCESIEKALLTDMPMVISLSGSTFQRQDNLDLVDYLKYDQFLKFSSFINKNLTEKQLRELFYKNYELKKQIGKGGFGTIFSATRLSDNKPVAIKIIKKAKVTQWYMPKLIQINQEKANLISNNNIDSIVTTRIPLEIALMIHVREVKNCIQILDYLEQNSTFIIIMERLEKSKDLFDFITEFSINNKKCCSGKSNVLDNVKCTTKTCENAGGLNEELARDFFKQIVETVMSLYELGVMHRDIKDENILVDLDTYQLKLIDFGAGTFFTDPNIKFNDFHGTRVYSPPEWILFQSYYGDRAAVWSLGVLLYNMIYGDIPWEEDNDIINCRFNSKKLASSNPHQIYHQNQQQYFSQQRHHYPNHINNFHRSSICSNEVDDLIRRCLSVENRRIKLEQILQHDWFLSMKCENSFNEDFNVFRNNKISANNDIENYNIDYLKISNYNELLDHNNNAINYNNSEIKNYDECANTVCSDQFK
jgi:serine/threonine protein kinase